MDQNTPIFDTEINNDMHTNVHDNTTFSVSNLVGGGIATVTDIGASIWNSLPLTPEVETADILKRVNANALNVYLENPDEVHTASFIGGMFVPMGAALKGMNMARSGVKGVNWFSNAGREADLAKMKTMFENAGAATQEFKNLQRSIYAKTAVNQAIDAVAAEAALVMTYNAHPFMEDYMKDIGSNFALSAMFGGAIGAGVGHIADRFAVNSLKSAASSKVFDDVLGKMTPLTEDMTSTIKVQRLDVDIKNLDEIISARKVMGKTENDDLTLYVAEKARLSAQASQMAIIDTMVSPTILEIFKKEPAKKLEFLDTIINKPEMFGVENYRFLTEADVTAEGLVKAPKFALGDKPSLIKTVQTDLGPMERNAQAVYFPEVGLYGTKKDAIHYAGASVYNMTKEAMEKSLPHNFGKIPNYDTFFELQAMSAAQSERTFISAFERVQKWTDKDFKNAHIGETDLPTLSAIWYRLKTDPSLKGITVKVSDNTPLIQQIEKQITETLVKEGKMTAAQVGAQGPEASYVSYMKKHFDDVGIRNFDPRVVGKGVSSDANAAIRSWIRGTLGELRISAVHALGQQVGRWSAAGTTARAAEIYNDIYKSEGSQLLRETLKSSVADSEGYVYLYRGWNSDHSKIRQGHTVESYTPHIEKAKEFGRPALYKVHVDDIIAGFGDSAGTGSLNAEFLVRSPARPIEAMLTPQGMLDFKKSVSAAQGSQSVTTTTTIKTIKETIAAGSKSVGIDEIESLLIASKQQALDTLLDAGMPLHSIAVKTSTPINTVETYAALRQTSNLAEVLGTSPEGIKNLFKFTSSESIDKTLDVANAPLVLSGNMRKNKLYTENHIQLDQKAMRVLNKTFISASMLSSKNEAVKEMFDMFYAPGGFGTALDIAAAKMSNAVNEKAGGIFFNSFDFTSRNMEELGVVASAVGKRVQQISNNHINKIVKPISDAMESVGKDVVALTEFNISYQVNASLKGWRWFDDEGFLVQKKMVKGTDGKMVETIEPVMYQGKPYQVKTPAVSNLWKEIQSHAVELKDLSNTISRIKGTPNVNDIGLWVPSFNPVDKFIGYVWNSIDDTTKMFFSRTEDGLKELAANLEKDIALNGGTASQQIKVITKGKDQEFWNKLNGRLDSIHMERADTSLQKAGSSSQIIPKPDITLLSEIAEGYRHYITNQVRQLADLNLSEVTSPLKQISEVNNWYYKGQPLSEVNKAVKKPKDSARIVLNTFMGDSNLKEYPAWEYANKTFEFGIQWASETFGSLWHDTVKPLQKKFWGKEGELDVKAVGKIDFEEFQKKLKDAGIINPYENWNAAAAQRFGLDKIENHPNTSKRIVHASNALAATLALRFAEIAQPLVNAISLPILTNLAISNHMPEAFMGVQKGTAKVAPAQIMYEGIRAMHSLLFKDLNKAWEKSGYFKPLVSEATDIYRSAMKFEKGAVASLENGLDSKFVEIMSKPSDLTESITRKASMNMGAVLAKRLYPELDDAGITIFARDFMDRAMGNFHASQRPVFFQGTLGVALGLFQTYMLTFAQQAYRALELKNYKALGKTMLLQGGIFGAQSLPGFDAVSHVIGDNFSDDNVDLVTGTYRGLPSAAADFVMYGLPSNLPFMGTVSTRGDVDPRAPVLNEPVAYSFVKQGYQMVSSVQGAMQADFPDMARSMGQALSLQSISRPIARGAELATGYSMTKHGNTVQTPEEVWSFQGVAARLMATRPLEEQKLRDADHLNHFYGAIDRENRENATKELRTAIRNGTLSDEKLAQYAEKYFRNGGTPAGWASARNTAIAKTDTPGRMVFIEKLRDDNPLNFMIEGLR